ncbi:hypothetical protein V8F20_012007 [Naviculisporaceae sp. PSN 640]
MDSAILLDEHIAPPITVALWSRSVQQTENNPQTTSKAQRQILKWYYDYYKDETAFVLDRYPSLFDGTSVSALVSLLRNNSQKEKRDLIETLCTSGNADVSRRTMALELIVRVAFVTGCSAASQDTFGGDLFRPRWQDSESLEAYIKRVYPRDPQTPQDGRSIRIDKLSAGYLTSYSKLEIIWAHRLTDHLLLLKRGNKKIVYIFRHPAFLRASLDALESSNATWTQSTSEAISLGCLPPQLIKETLATYTLLFPEPGDQASRTILEREVNENNLDPSFLDPFYPQHTVHEHPQDALDPDDVRSLYQKYPHWAERLYSLWKEAEDPTPVTMVERWSESRKNPRFTYWCTVVSLSIAIAFGAVATVLGALQVWISYCGWVADPGATFCSRGGHSSQGNEGGG